MKRIQLSKTSVLLISLGVLAIIYGALCAMAQTDWKKLVAYSSVSHMGYVDAADTLAALTAIEAELIAANAIDVKPGTAVSIASAAWA